MPLYIPERNVNTPDMAPIKKVTQIQKTLSPLRPLW